MSITCFQSPQGLLARHNYKVFSCLFCRRKSYNLISSATPPHVLWSRRYDAHKSGGVTTSHLRFGKQPIKAPYLVADADYIGVHQAQYLSKYDVLGRLRKNGVVLINAPWKNFEVRAAHDLERSGGGP